LDFTVEMSTGEADAFVAALRKRCQAYRDIGVEERRGQAETTIRIGANANIVDELREVAEDLHAAGRDVAFKGTFTGDVTGAGEEYFAFAARGRNFFAVQVNSQNVPMVLAYEGAVDQAGLNNVVRFTETLGAVGRAFDETQEAARRAEIERGRAHTREM
jgi:hypothetical protein